MKKIFKELWNEIPVRARYLLCFGAGLVLSAIIIFLRVATY